MFERTCCPRTKANGGSVVEYRLEEVYHTLGMDIPNNITLKEYILV